MFSSLQSLREKENLLSKAAEANISSEEANKLRSQAAEITFDDITECINVSFKYCELASLLLVQCY